MSETETRQAVRLVISGRVQGVGFRYYARRAAARLGLVGWVKNLPGGEVDVRVAGEPPALESFRRQLRQGPPGARVDEISESELAVVGEWTQFEIAF